MRTARNAGPSVAQSFDDDIDFGGNLLPQRQRRGPRIGRFRVMPDGDAAFGKALAEPVQEDIAARFGDVEKCPPSARRDFPAGAGAVGLPDFAPTSDPKARSC